MRRWLLSALAAVLAFVMTPGAFELVENVAHAVTHGDSAHVDDDGHSQRSSSDEHGCSGAVHACTCCHSLQFAPAACGPTAPVACAAIVQAPARTAPIADAPVGRVFRPPRS